MFQISHSLMALESMSELQDALPLNTQLPIAHVDYRHPASDEVRLVLDDAGLTEVRAASLLGVTDLTMRTWLSQGAEESTIPYMAWRLLLIELRVLDVARDEPACANWLLVNRSIMADSMTLGPYPVQCKIGPYTSYRVANNIAAKKMLPHSLNIYPIIWQHMRLNWMTRTPTSFGSR